VTFQVTEVKQPVDDMKLVQQPDAALDAAQVERPK
jgi:hypothetical protein